jgi:hypothetical protein
VRYQPAARGPVCSFSLRGYCNGTEISRVLVVKQMRSLSLRFLLVLIASCPPLLPAQVDIGIIGGVPLLPVMRTNGSASRFHFIATTAAARPYTFGASADLTLRGPLAIESGLMFKRLGFDSFSQSGFSPYISSQTTSSTKGNAWEIPILAKVRLWFPAHLKGFVALGPALRRVAQLHEVGVLVDGSIPNRIEVIPIQTDSPANMARRTSLGASFAAGLDFRVSRLLVSPALRYTFWTTQLDGPFGYAPRFQRSQADIQLRIAYTAASDVRSRARIPDQLGAGILTGVSVLDGFEALSFEAPFTLIRSPRLVLGALVEWRLPSRFSLEASFVAQRDGYTRFYQFGENRVRATIWQAPLLLRWRAANGRRSAPVFGLGPAIRRVRNIEHMVLRQGQSGSAYTPGYRQVVGCTISAGVEFGSGAIHWRPELRYSRYAASNRIPSAFPASGSLAVLVAITAGPSASRKSP